MSTSTSDHDMSDSSSSPMSYIRYSPHSSPSQTVPQLATDLTELTCADNKRQFLRHASKPCLRITEQPQNHFRFRYVSEMVGTHGCLLGKTVGPNKQKTHPTVELLHYSGKALIRCRLAQHNNPDEHPHKLLEDEQDRDMSYLVPDQGIYKVGFGGIGIIHTAKKDVAALLFKKFSERCKTNTVNLKDGVISGVNDPIVKKMMKKTNSPNCVQCGVVEDLHHLLMECVRYEPERNDLFRVLKLNRLEVGTFHNILSRPNSDDAKSLFRFMALI